MNTSKLTSTLLGVMTAGTGYSLLRNANQLNPAETALGTHSQGRPMYDELIKALHEKTNYTLSAVKRPASGCLHHDYLVPGGPYEEQWDWDAFFMATALIHENPHDAVYMKNWALNYLENAANNGHVPGCITPAGADPRLNQMKPLLAQGCLKAVDTLNDTQWLKPHWSTLQAVVDYRYENLWNHDYQLPVWFDSMESGADNNVAVMDYPDKSVLSTDVAAFSALEYRSLAQLAQHMGDEATQRRAQDISDTVISNVEKHLWHEEDGMYYNKCAVTGEWIKRVSYSTFMLFWANIADERRAKSAIEHFLLNDDHMRCEFGFRTLSKQDEMYNNVNMIKPHSNWQGPVWPLANYLYMIGLLNYGYRDAAIDLAVKSSHLVINDIDRTGGMHENYDAETGLPLAAPNFISWNILVRGMLTKALEQ